MKKFLPIIMSVDDNLAIITPTCNDSGIIALTSRSLVTKTYDTWT